MRMKHLPYLLVKDLVKTGDCLFFVGSSLLAQGILQFSEFSHVALIIRYDDLMPHYKDRCVQTVEALDKGIEPYFFTDRVKAETLVGTEVYWLPVNLSENQRLLCREYVLAEIPLHRQYGYGTLVSNAFGYQPIAYKESRICSEWVAAVYVACCFVDWQIAPRPGDIQNWLGKRAEDLVKIIGPKPNEALDNIC